MRELLKFSMEVPTNISLNDVILFSINEKVINSFYAQMIFNISMLLSSLCLINHINIQGA